MEHQVLRATIAFSPSFFCCVLVHFGCDADHSLFPETCDVWHHGEGMETTVLQTQTCKQ